MNKEVKVTIPYIGRALSVNYYKIVGRSGFKTNKTRPEVEEWMVELAERVKGVQFTSDHLTISLFGRFTDSRVPDLANLHKVIGDAIADGLGMDDRNFKFRDLGYSTGWLRPELEITIED